jgi:hypothetical protein
MKEFIVNEYITLKLENDETNIYVKNKLFSQCKYILLQDLRVDEVDEYVRLFNSVDEQAEILDHSLERKDNAAIHLSPEDEFWAHCSNLLIWVEQNYDTRLLHSNLAFPLLRKLYEEKVPVASIAFKEEIAERFANGYIPTIFYILEEGYLKYLDKK